MRPEVTSEHGRLKKVLLHTPGREHLQQIPWDGSHPLFSPKTPAVEELRHDHAQLRRALAAECGEENVLELTDLAREVFAAAEGPRREALLAEILGSRSEPYLGALRRRGVVLDRYPADELVEDLVCGCPRDLAAHEDRLPDLLFPALRSLMWLRDSAFNTPCGLVVGSMSAGHRQAEPAFVRAVLRHHPLFAGNDLLLDLVDRARRDPQSAAECFLEGGNVVVIDAETVAVGVGEAAFRYARKTTRSGFGLLMERLFAGAGGRRVERIYLVHMPDLAGFIHLDTIFNFFGPRAAVAMPYILGQPLPSPTADPAVVLREFVSWITRGAAAEIPSLPTTEHLEWAGRVEVYEREHIRRAGEMVPLPGPPAYFLDQLAKDGYLDLDRVVWIGGSPEEHPSPYQHLRMALYEQRNQAGNVFATGPFHIVAYRRNPLTVRALQAAVPGPGGQGHLTLMDSNELRTGGGGPRCLTMPLGRQG